MTKPKAAGWCTDGVWAGRLQNRWFLTVRDASVGKLAILSQWLCVMHSIKTGYLNSADHARGVARLAVGTGRFGCRFYCTIRRFAFVHITIGHAFCRS